MDGRPANAGVGGLLGEVVVYPDDPPVRLRLGHLAGDSSFPQPDARPWVRSSRSSPIDSASRRSASVIQVDQSLDLCWLDARAGGGHSTERDAHLVEWHQEPPGTGQDAARVRRSRALDRLAHCRDGCSSLGMPTAVPRA